MEKALRVKKKQLMLKLCAFENMSILDSDEETLNTISSEEGGIWKVDSDVNLNINANDKYESLHSCLISQSNLNINQSFLNSVSLMQQDLVLIAFENPQSEMTKK